jgi:hypothetical protein
MYVVGDVHNVIVKRQDNEYLIGVLEKHERFAGRKRSRKNSVESAATKRVRKESVGQSTASENAESEIENDKMETSVVLEEEIKTEDEIKVEIKEEDPGTVQFVHKNEADLFRIRTNILDYVEHRC